MSGDSQRVRILGGENEIEVVAGSRSRNPITIRTGGGFVGLIGFAGTEEIEGAKTSDWIRNFSANWPDDDVGSFCERLASRLREVWEDGDIKSVLEILVSGEVSGDVQFWYVRNSRGIRTDGKHEEPTSEFATENDLDNNYIPLDRPPGASKGDVLRSRMYSFRQGVLLPASPVFDAFAALMGGIYAHRIKGFEPIDSLDDVGHFARVRMEFLKRLCTAKYGIFASDTSSPVGGIVHVLGVGCAGEIREYSKGRQDVRTLRPGRT